MDDGINIDHGGQVSVSYRKGLSSGGPKRHHPCPLSDFRSLPLSPDSRTREVYVRKWESRTEVGVRRPVNVLYNLEVKDSKT